jgi:hypothetical protein
MYAQARPTFFVDPTGFESDLAALAKRNRESQTGEGRKIVSGGQVGQVAFEDTPVQEVDRGPTGGVVYYDELGIDVDALAEEHGPPKPTVVIEEESTLKDRAADAVDWALEKREEAAQWVGEEARAQVKKSIGSRAETAADAHRRAQAAALPGGETGPSGSDLLTPGHGEQATEVFADVAEKGSEQVTREVIDSATVPAVAKLRRLAPRTKRGIGGRVESAFARIEPQHLGSGTRTSEAARRGARQLGSAADDAGHLIANRLGGPGGAGYVVPQNARINRGAFRLFEQQVAADVKAGREVFVRVAPRYHGGATRPYEIAYQVRVDGRTRTVVFPNPQ